LSPEEETSRVHPPVLSSPLQARCAPAPRAHHAHESVKGAPLVKLGWSNWAGQTRLVKLGWSNRRRCPISIEELAHDIRGRLPRQQIRFS
jgi:hypothetical protein